VQPRSVKTKINQLIKERGSIEKVAEDLRISRRWVYHLKGGTVPGIHLFEKICELTKEKNGSNSSAGELRP